MNTKKIILEDFTLDILKKSWYWLNDQEIKKLTQTPDFTIEQQKKWFDNLKNTPNYLVKGIKYGDEIIGVVGLKNIDFLEKKAEYFGYIGEKEYWGKGLSSQIFELIIDMCKKEKINTLYLNVIPENKRAIRAYEKAGFKQVEILNNNIKMTLDLL